MTADTVLPRAARWALALGLASAVVLGTAGAASAHAVLERSSPLPGQVLAQPSASVQLWFSENVETAVSSVRVLSTDGSRVDRGSLTRVGGDRSTLEAALNANLATGSYIVLWRVVSQDGHPATGRFVFSVGRPGTLPATPIDASPGALAGHVALAAGALTYLGMAVLVGTGWFVRLCWPGGTRSARVRWLLGGSAGLTLIASLAAVVAQSAQWAQTSLVDALDPTRLVLVWQTRFGVAALIRCLAAALVVVLVLMDRREPVRRPGARPRGSAGPPLLGLIVVVSVAVAGHAGTTDPVTLALPFGMAHLAAVSLWLGSVPVITVALLQGVRLPARVTPRRARELASEQLRRKAEVVAALRRFGPVALGCVVVVLVTGAAQALLQGVGPASAPDTDYGHSLLVKLALVGVVLVIAGLSGFLARRADGTHDEPADGPLPRRLRAVVSGEGIAAVAVLVATAVLSQQPPARVEIHLPVERTVSAGPVTFDLTQLPLGPRSFGLLIAARDDTGRPVGLPSLTARLVDPADPTRSIPVSLPQDGNGSWALPQLTLPRAGDWSVELSFDTQAAGSRTVAAQFRVR